MYIPPVPRAPTDPLFPAVPPNSRWGSGRSGAGSAAPDRPLPAHHPLQLPAPRPSPSRSAPVVLSELASAICSLARHPTQLTELRKRNTPLQNTNLTIGIVVGVLLGIFLIGVLVFLGLYRNSVKFSKKRRKRKGSGSKASSKSSKSSDAGGAPPAPPPAPSAPAA